MKFHVGFRKTCIMTVAVVSCVSFLYLGRSWLDITSVGQTLSTSPGVNRFAVDSSVRPSPSPPQPSSQKHLQRLPMQANITKNIDKPSPLPGSSHKPSTSNDSSSVIKNRNPPQAQNRAQDAKPVPPVPSMLVTTVNKKTLTVGVTVPTVQNRSMDLLDTSVFKTKHTGYNFLSKTFREDNVDYSPVIEYRRQNPTTLNDLWFSDLEVEMLHDLPLLDLETVARPQFSTVHMVNSSSRETSGFRVGDLVTVRVDLRDSRGRNITIGGHSVRVWIEGQGPEGRKSAAADVIDMRNGSYIASFPVLWTGDTNVVAGLMRPREYRALMLKTLDSKQTVYMNTGVYSTQLPVLSNYTQHSTTMQTVEQVTYCMDIPAVPGFAKMCNHTRENDGLPWFCGQPTVAGLNCSHWSESRATDYLDSYPATDAENSMMRPYFNKGYSYRIPQEYTFNAQPGLQLAQNAPCSERAPRDTWTDSSPRGLWEGKTWRPLACSVPRMTKQFVNKCLRDTNIILLGDSNTRAMLMRLKALTECQMEYTYRKQVHDPILCSQPSLNFFVGNFPHAYPFIVHAEFTTRKSKHSPRDYLSKIPQQYGVGLGMKVVVVIHLYAHQANLHTDTYGRVVRDTAKGVRDLLDQNPHIKVFIRGPHAFIWNPMRVHVLGDLHLERAMRIFQHEFRDLMDRVILLNTFDMTVANQNLDVHPEVVNDIVDVFLGHVCSPPG